MKHQYVPEEPRFTPSSIDMQSVSRQKGYTHLFRYGRAKHGFIHTVSGRMQYIFNDGEEKSICVAAGEVIFIPRGSVYTSVYLENHTENRMVQFDLVQGELPAYLSVPLKLGLPHAGELIERFFDPPDTRTAAHPFYYLSCLYTLLWQIDRGYARLPAKYKKLQAALAELGAHWKENKPISFYAELCRMSEVHFRRLFRAYTGTTPVSFRNDLRLKHARAMLGCGEYNVSEAAEAAGFSNLSFFTRLYKKKYGYTPKQE